METNYHHLISNRGIKHDPHCYGCAFKIFEKPNTPITFGIGNIISDTMIIVNPYDYTKPINKIKILNILYDTYLKITGKDIFEECYITRFVKCNVKGITFNQENSAPCMTHLIKEYNMTNVKKIIYINSVCELFTDCCKNIKTIKISNPLYKTSDNIDDFIEEFRKAIYD